MRNLLMLFILIFTGTSLMAQWSEQTSPTTNELYSVSVVDNSVAWACGRNGTVIRTTNGGSNWNIVGSSYFQGVIHLYTIFALDAQTAFCVHKNPSPLADYTYVFKTTNGGVDWTVVFVESGGDIKDVVMTSSQNGFMYGSPHNQFWEFFSTTNGGTDWVQFSSLAETGFVEFGRFNSMYFTNSDIYIGSNTGNIYHSVDGGASWNSQTASEQNINIIWFNDSQNGLAGENSLLDMTTDGGSSWTPLNSLTGLDSVSAVTGIGNQWWVANQDNIYYSQNNMNSWTTQYSTPSGRFIHMERARNGNLLLAVRDNGGISAYNIPVPVELSSFTAAAEGTNVLLSWSTSTETNNKGFSIERSVGENEWEEIGFVQGCGTTTEENTYSYTDKNLAAGNYIYKLVQVDFDGSENESEPVTVVVNVHPLKYALEQNYPNPFNPATSIKYTIPDAGALSIKVFNSLGQEISKLTDGYKSAGTYSLNFDGSGLPSGIYYYRIETKDYSAVRKMILLR